MAVTLVVSSTAGDPALSAELPGDDGEAGGPLHRAVAATAAGHVTVEPGGVAGLALLFFWFGTDHAVARLNLNVLVLNPLWLVFVARGRAARYALPVVSILAALAVAWTGLPPAQYTADVLAALLPLNIAAAWSVSRAARAGRWPGRA